MTHQAATATTPPATNIATPADALTDLLPATGTMIAIGLLVVLVAALGYAAACAADPFGRCRRCHGNAKSLSPGGRVKRWCRHCDGTGLRLRLGRRLYNYLRRLRRDATR